MRFIVLTSLKIALIACFLGASNLCEAKIMLGIDALEEQKFAPLKGKRIGLLSHPAGVNAAGRSTVDVLLAGQKKGGFTLVSLFGPEHGFYGDEEADQVVHSSVDKRTGLQIHSLYGQTRRPTAAMLKGLDTMVIDLQDLGVRSYTYICCMRYVMEECFKAGIAVMVLDRPNPQGGLIVDGPPMEERWISYVGAFPVPYVYGLTIGELARMAKQTAGFLQIDDTVRASGVLWVIPMKGWQRSMRWNDTGLSWVPTSPNIPTIEAAWGYPLLGLSEGVSHGIGTHYPFQLVSILGVDPKLLVQKMRALRLAGLSFSLAETKNKASHTQTGVLVHIDDPHTYSPTSLNFYLMRLVCQLKAPINPYEEMASSRAVSNTRLFESKMDLLNKHLGTAQWMNALVKEGAAVNVEFFVHQWHAQALEFQANSKQYWLYK